METKEVVIITASEGRFPEVPHTPIRFRSQYSVNTLRESMFMGGLTCQIDSIPKTQEALEYRKKDLAAAPRREITTKGRE